MSIDNCIAILKTTDKFKVQGAMHYNTFGKGITAYRVAHIQAVDNFQYYMENEIHNLGYCMHSYFRGVDVLYSYEEAIKLAKKLLAEEIYVEHGIVEIDASKYNFPGC